MIVTEISTEQMVTLFVTVVAPLLVGLFTKASWSSTVKALSLAGVSAVIGVAQGFLAAPPDVAWDWKVAVVNAVIAWVIAVATYFGLWKPTGTTDKVQAMLIKDAPPQDPPLAA